MWPNGALKAPFIVDCAWPSKFYSSRPLFPRLGKIRGFGALRSPKEWELIMTKLSQKLIKPK
jgi:hypothetical protein